jgi:ketosteroid isomerase-like protein
MGTTLTVAYVGEDDLTVAHVGDSRLYRLRDGTFERLTDDHSLVEELDPAVEWHPAAQAGLAGEATVFRGREEVRKGIQDLVEAFDDLRFEVSEFRDLGDELLAFGRVHAHGTESGVEIDSPLAWLVRAKNGKAIWVRSYLDPKEALEAAGLSE